MEWRRGVIEEEIFPFLFQCKNRSLFFVCKYAWRIDTHSFEKKCV